MRLFEADYSQRDIYSNILELFQKNNLRNGSFVSLGYFNKVKIQAKLYPTQANTMKAMELIKSKSQDDTSDWDEKLNSMINNPMWSDTMNGKVIGSNKKPKQFINQETLFGEEISGLIKFSRYTFNFQDSSSLSKSFQKSKEEEMEIRRKYGFDKEDSDFDVNDWRLKQNSSGRYKYRGPGVEPRVDPRDVNKGSSYVQGLGNIPIYGDVDLQGNQRTDDLTNNQRMTIRQNISSKIKQEEAKYFLVYKNGTMTQVPKNFIDFFVKDLKPQVEDAIEELVDEEKQFVKELNDLKNKYFVTQFITDKIAFFVGTVQDDKTKQFKKIAFINKNLNLLDDNRDIDKQQLDSFISKQFNVSEKEVDYNTNNNINESKSPKKLLENAIRNIVKKLIKESVNDSIKQDSIDFLEDVRKTLIRRYRIPEAEVNRTVANYIRMIEKYDLDIVKDLFFDKYINFNRNKEPNTGEEKQELNPEFFKGRDSVWLKNTQKGFNSVVQKNKDKKVRLNDPIMREGLTPKNKLIRLNVEYMLFEFFKSSKKTL